MLPSFDGKMQKASYMSLLFPVQLYDPCGSKLLSLSPFALFLVDIVPSAAEILLQSIVFLASTESKRKQ